MVVGGSVQTGFLKVSHGQEDSATGESVAIPQTDKGCNEEKDPTFLLVVWMYFLSVVAVQTKP